MHKICNGITNIFVQYEPLHLVNFLLSNINKSYDWVLVSLNISCDPVSPQGGVPGGHLQFCMRRDSSLPVPSPWSRVKLNMSAQTSPSLQMSISPSNLWKSNYVDVRNANKIYQISDGNMWRECSHIWWRMMIFPEVMCHILIKR